MRTNPNYYILAGRSKSQTMKQDELEILAYEAQTSLKQHNACKNFN